MKIYTQKELEERNDLLRRLSFIVTDSFNEFDVEECKLYITFFNEDGCMYDDDMVDYLFQDELPDEIDYIIEGLYGYDGDLSAEELEELLNNIGFNN